MGTENESTMKDDDRSNSSTKYGGQHNQNSDKNKNEPQLDKTKRGSDMNSPKPSEQDQSPEKKKYEVQGDSHESTQHGSGENQSNTAGRNPRDDKQKNIDRERRPEEQVIKQKEPKRDEQKFNDKSERV